MVVYRKGYYHALHKFSNNTRFIKGIFIVVEELSGIFVKSITEGSTADLDGRIQVNDQIIQVNMIHFVR